MLDEGSGYLYIWIKLFCLRNCFFLFCHGSNQNWNNKHSYKHEEKTAYNVPYECKLNQAVEIVRGTLYANKSLAILYYILA